ncbi:MAG TPA: hypothetical protein VGY54_19690 [Polyangiaceae bacterium]|nr:hypothetical protein [Polyangiaceae bacterium]
MSFNPATLFETCRTLFGTTQEGLGNLLGVSRRTAQRWANTGIPGYYLIDVARLVHPRDPALALEIVTALGTTLEAQGLVSPAPTPSPLPPSAPPAPDPPAGIVDAVVCAAAEAMEMMPKEVRPGLHAAFARAKEIGLTVDMIERALRSKLRGADQVAAATEAPADAGPQRPSKRSNVAVDQLPKGKRLETRR